VGLITRCLSQYPSNAQLQTWRRIRINQILPHPSAGMGVSSDKTYYWSTHPPHSFLSMKPQFVVPRRQFHLCDARQPKHPYTERVRRRSVGILIAICQGATPCNTDEMMGVKPSLLTVLHRRYPIERWFSLWVREGKKVSLLPVSI
jgi:hypothetical protein